MVCVVMKTKDGGSRGNSDEMGLLFAPSYSRWGVLSVGFCRDLEKGRSCKENVEAPSLDERFETNVRNKENNKRGRGG